ncbi:MAG: ParB/RepB/Spo0J family partition protein [Clostridiales bacterium]
MPKNQNKRGVGKGLGALIPAATEEFILEGTVGATELELKADVGAQLLVDVKSISPSVEQSRKIFNDDKIEELTASIKAHGVIQPLIVREHGKNKYELIAGERRLRGAKQAGLKKVPVVIIEAEDNVVAELGLIENLQREDLSPLEEAQAFRRMMDDYGHTQESLGDILGKSRSYIANSLRLLTLTEAETESLRNGEITPGHARAVLSVKTADGRSFLLDEIIRKSLSVRQAEDLAKRINDVGEKPVKKQKTDKIISTPFRREMENKLRQRFGTKVKIKTTPYGGCIEIDYYNEDDLDRILSMVVEEEKSLKD